jgi:hypothetical protein
MMEMTVQQVLFQASPQPVAAAAALTEMAVLQ